MITGIIGLIMSGIVFMTRINAEESIKNKAPSPTNAIDVKSIQKTLD